MNEAIDRAAEQLATTSTAHHTPSILGPVDEYRYPADSLAEIAILLVESFKDNTHVTDRLSDRELRLLDRYDAAFSDMQAITNSRQSVA